MKFGSDETTLRALHKCGITVSRWEEDLKATLKPSEDYAGWVDNINAVVFPGFFENRNRQDRHEADFTAAEQTAVSDEETPQT